MGMRELEVLLPRDRPPFLKGRKWLEAEGGGPGKNTCLAVTRIRDPLGSVSSLRIPFPHLSAGAELGKPPAR